MIDILRATANDCPHGVLILDESGTLIASNQPAGNIFGYKPGDLVGQTIERLVPDSSRLLRIDLWKRDSATGADRSVPRQQTVSGLRKDGASVPVEIALNIIDASNQRYVVASIDNVADRLKVERDLLAVGREGLAFQRLMADVAASFLKCDAATLDGMVADLLRLVAQVLELDRLVLWRWSDDESLVMPVHGWSLPTGEVPAEPLPVASAPYTLSRLEAGETVSFTALDELPDSVDRITFRQRGERSALLIPMPYQGGGTDVHWVLTASSMTRELEWPPAIVERLRLLAGVVSQALARQASQIALQQALDDLHQLRTRPSESVVRRPEGPRTGAASRIVSESADVREALIQIEQVAGTSATVLLRGETGAGKEVFAQAIHDLSPRHRRPMVVVSCAAIPTALIESELFGRERGAYTGALSRQIGRFEAAHQSTLFLDEIGDLPAEMQVKLLRVLQERVIERLGSTQPIKVDVRIIAATHRDLEQAVREGTFREDLFYRLNVFPIRVPPLRERIADIPGLVWAFVDELSRAFGKTITSISPPSMQELQRYAWPGNVRELRNVIERAVILATTEHLVVPMPHTAATPLPPTAMTLASLETEHIRAILDSTHWRVRGRGGAAERLGLKPTTLESRMARLGIVRERAS